MRSERVKNCFRMHDFCLRERSGQGASIPHTRCVFRVLEPLRDADGRASRESATVHRNAGGLYLL